MNILGIDPGTQILGIGIIKSEKNQPVYLFNKDLILKKIKDRGTKFTVIFNEINNIIDEYSVNEISLEKAFTDKDYHASEMLNQVRGIIWLISGLRNIPLSEYAPAKVKKILTGNGRADKITVQKIVELTINKRFTKTTDSIDALAIALTHYYLTQKLPI